MNEDLKIAEAEYFYGRMLATRTRTPEHFRFNLSAFLTSARSALQYALEDAKLKPGGQKWYKAAVTAHPNIKFLREKRNVNIHAAPVEAPKTYNVKLSDDVRAVDQVEVQAVRAGDVVQHVRSETSPVPAAAEATPASNVHYRFADWPGSEDVVALCRVYLDAVTALVADGQHKGFLTAPP